MTRQMSMTTRKELVEALRVRYRRAAFGDRIQILDEFVALTGYHRKHAIRVLREEVATAKAARTRNRLYDEAVRQALTVLWEAADRVCGKPLKALIPMLVDAMERHGHLDLDPVIKTKVMQVSAATIDRVLAPARLHIDGQRKRRKGIGSAIRRSIPVRTFADWRDPPSGFFEIDMVEHCGGVKTEGEFVDTLTLTDIASGWTECVAMRVREQMLVVEAFDKVAAEPPFTMLGVDSDNDSAFMSQSVFDYCKGHGLEQTRSRAYKKNDQAWVEQKNGAVVRRLVGYGRLSGGDAVRALELLYASSRLYINFFQPSFKLKSKTRDGARVHKVYFTPATPCDRLLTHSSIEPVIKEKLNAQFKGLDPVRLLQEIRLVQQTLSDLAAHGVRAEGPPAKMPDVEVFLKSLSSAWKDGEVRPTHRKQPTAKHWWRTRVDPFADAWPVVEGWLTTDPTVSAKALMERLAAMVPDAYASKAQLRTLQRRVKAWRAERAKEMILGRLRINFSSFDSKPLPRSRLGFQISGPSVELGPDSTREGMLQRSEIMALWDDSHWVDGYVARITNVFAGGNTAWIDFGYEALLAHQGTGHVGWRQLVSEQPTGVSDLLAVACISMQLNRRVQLRATNDGRITAIQTVS